MSSGVDREVMQHLMARCVANSDTPNVDIDSFQKTLDGLRNVIGGQHKTLQELK